LVNKNTHDNKVTPAKDYVFFIQCELFTKFGILSLRFDAISEKSADTIFKTKKI
jgi:hypothetical protein